MRKFIKARIPVVTVYVMYKWDDECQPALWIADGNIDARNWVNKKGLNGLVKYNETITFDYPIIYDEITGKIVKKYVDIFN